MERKEFTPADVHILAALLEQVQAIVAGGGISVHADEQRSEVHLRPVDFRRLFREWTLEDFKDYHYPFQAVAKVGEVTFFALISKADVPNWTPAPIA